MSTMDIDRIVRMSAGNPGAINVLCELVKQGFEGTLDKVETLGLSGSQIWLAYKDYAGFDLEKMTIGLLQEKPELWEVWIACGEPLAVKP